VIFSGQPQQSLAGLPANPAEFAGRDTATRTQFSADRSSVRSGRSVLVRHPRMEDQIGHNRHMAFARDV
jgi:hypothetical protein